jgi:O-methyltransferase
VDCGTWNGGSAALLSAGSPWRDVWAFDSFQGTPPASDRDFERSSTEEERQSGAGLCRGEEEKLREAVERYGNPHGLRVCPGWFDQTLVPAAQEIGPIAVLHCDSDLYDSLMCTLDTLYPLVSPGGWIAVGDYGGKPAVHLAVDQFRARVGDQERLHKADQTGCYWRKPR